MKKSDKIKWYRRDLSGIYIFDTLPQDERRKPTCLEDCTESKRLEWLDAQHPECLSRVAGHLNETFGHIWDELRPEERNMIRDAHGCMPHCDTSLHKSSTIHDINRFCKLIRYIAEHTGLCAATSEAARLIKK